VESKTNAEVAAGFRRLAELLETHPDMRQPYEGSTVPLLFMSHSKEQFAATIKAFGKGVKSNGGDTLDFTPTDFPLPVRVYGFKSNICEKRPVTRVVPATSARVIPEQFISAVPEHEVTSMEYICDPAFLRVAEEPVEGVELASAETVAELKDSMEVV
jgi:hypothetical protein